MSRNRDKYANLKRERLLGSYIVKGKDKSLRIGYTGDLYETLREIKKSVEVQDVVLFKGAAEDQFKEAESILRSYFSVQDNQAYSIELDHAKAILAVFHTSECLLNPKLEVTRPKKWKTLSSWKMGEVLVGKLILIPTNKRFSRRFALALPEGQTLGLYTNKQLSDQLSLWRDGDTVHIECKKPFKEGAEDAPNQASQFQVLPLLDERTYVKASDRYQSNPRSTIKRIRR